MTLVLKSGMEVKTYPQSTGLEMRIGETHMSIGDLFSAAYYALVNNDLAEDDVRMKFIDAVKKLEVVNSVNAGGKKLKYPGIHAQDFFTCPFEY